MPYSIFLHYTTTPPWSSLPCPHCLYLGLQLSQATFQGAGQGVGAVGNALVGAGTALSVLQLVLEVVDVGEGLAQLALSIVLLGLAALQAHLQLLNLTHPQHTGSASTHKVSIMSDSIA